MIHDAMSSEIEMSVREALMLELRVAFSRKGQPIWFRVLKWMVLVFVGAYLWRSSHFWWWIGGALGLGVTVHLVWRWKTKRWTRAWGGWSDLDAARGVRRR
jgi:hypothetical protein